ncbi:MAG: manganese efflux pump [Bacteroidales bacterium]|nr:manganese efflux pump [Bacteroidales bacterium]
MSFWEILLLAVAVSMDAFAVSVGKGLSVQKISWLGVLSVALWFGGFQALMPVIGYYLGVSFADLVEKIDHWIAFALLAFIGGNMIREALQRSSDEAAEKPDNRPFAFRTMLLLAVATSIDALAVGISFAFLRTPLWSSVAIIGVTTGLFSVAGLLLGKKVGDRFHKGAEILGGIILIAIGLKILIEHLSV